NFCGSGWEPANSNMSAEDERRERYLWDPDAPADPDVRALEQRLASARYDASRRPLALPTRPFRNMARVRIAALAAAAVALIAIGLGAYWSWRWSWAAGASWAAEIDDSSDHSAVKTTVALDQPFRLAPTSSARVDIARIGTMNLAPGSTLTITETRANRHR